MGDHGYRTKKSKLIYRYLFLIIPMVQGFDMCDVFMLTPDQANDMNFIRRVLSADMDVQSIEPLFHKSYNSYSYQVNGNIIIKFSRRYPEKMQREAQILNLLQGRISMPVPKIQIISCDGYVYSKHAMIMGQPPLQSDVDAMTPTVRARFCADIARFAFEMHAATDFILNRVCIPQWERYSMRSMRPALIADKIITDENFTDDERAFIERFCNDYTIANDDAVVRLGHFDMQPKNIAYNHVAGRIAGIFDFGDCAHGDIYHDFAQLALGYSPDILAQILDEYAHMGGHRVKLAKCYDYALHQELNAYCRGYDIGDADAVRIKMNNRIRASQILSYHNQ